MIKVLPALMSIALFLGAGCTASHPSTADASSPVSAASDGASAAPAISSDTSAIMPELPRDPAALSSSGSFGVSMPASAWKVATSHNGPVEENLISSVSDSRRMRLIVRQFGKKLEIYLTAGEELDDVDTASKNRSLVKYKFDDGELARAEWIVSQHRTALLFTGDPLEFIEKIRKAKRLDMELPTAADSLDAESFNLVLFPDGIISGLEKTQ
ncbi:MAG: hypothetical protein P4L56_09485 [Candidatus Sulfopaludibacter sp.]|nr:hypothetical protein [Candidatus Sulfopaludibacter sp.]